MSSIRFSYLLKMDAEFQQRWLAGSPPFDGVTLFTTQFVRLPILLRIVSPIANYLHTTDGGTDLFTLDDWHEHDGCISPSSPSCWPDLLSLCASVEALAAAQADDMYVRKTYFPESRAWIFRLYIPEPDLNLQTLQNDPDLVDAGDFDLTCSEAMAAKVLTNLDRYVASKVKTESAKWHFDHSA